MSWARNWECCRICGSTTNKHQGHGLCSKCHAAAHYGEYPSQSYEARKATRNYANDKTRNERTRRWEKKHPERTRQSALARKRVERALNGKRMECAVSGCGEIAEAHHPDYRQPLQIIPLCPHHHRELHKGNLESKSLLIVDLSNL